MLSFARRHPSLTLSSVVLCAGWLAANLDIGGDPAIYQETIHWAHTVDGWERAVWEENPLRDPPIHPVVIGSFIALSSTLALLAIPPADDRARS